MYIPNYFQIHAWKYGTFMFKNYSVNVSEIFAEKNIFLRTSL